MAILFIIRLIQGVGKMPRAKSTGRRLRRTKENRKKCKVIIIYEGGKKILCGEEFWGKRRYCGSSESDKNTVVKEFRDKLRELTKSV